ncbi:hypothetical protein NQ315_004888 [Exocentrus adspersus]|uniref:Pyridoxal kinase n=1 Tax=Exocentrus adspersus TaxID=1586481 RepID=A0AAV8W2T6_9CUCU|nr:hypothetical protein NQ315_004888 [Exocentrus adspersus]
MVESPRVLSIQSHVVSGYVGNKSAVFPLQLLGFEVDAINSVQFSNHTGYKKVKGQILTEKDLADLLEGLSENHLDYYSHLLTGYIGSVSFLNQITTVVKHLRQKNPNLIYVCDPVMGDNGQLYVPKELVPIYKSYIVPLATIITPNLFEAELLTDTKIINQDDVWNAINILHNKGCETVVISSADLGTDSKLGVFGSCKKDDTIKKIYMEIKKLPVTFTGSGDLFAALFLSWMYKSNNDLKVALENTIASLQAVLKRTVEGLGDEDIKAKNVELKLIQSKKDIEEPNDIYQAVIIE